MQTTYEEYLTTPKSLTIENMQNIHQQMLAEIGEDTDAEEIYEEIIQTATKYANFRANWLLWDKATKMERDSSRSACHNSVIVKFNMLARYLKMQGKEVKWREALGDEEADKYARKTIGDFACYLVFINSINAR
ncbi:MAG: hypothetical protein J6A75_06190 [Lachnospiraceae bacterium]|nr:hypothetical protein [Lachnospiraceae bacterium]